MKSSRVLVLLILASILSVMLAACGGGGSKPAPPPAQLVITSTVLPQGTVNVPYHFTVQANGGTGTYTWAISKGSLPPGLSLNTTTAFISGTPTTFGVYPLTLQVTDGAGTVASEDLSLTIEGVLILKCDSCASGTNHLPYANPGVPYSATVSVTGGQTPYSWCVVENNGNCDNGSGGALPVGLTISTDSSGNGVISGIPTTPGTPTGFTVQASDSEKIVSRGSMNLIMTVFDLGPKTLPNATLNTPYNQNVSGIGGQSPYTWTLTGNLPPGLSFGTCIRKQAPTCPIVGTPTQVGTTTFTLTVTDGENPPASATADVTITVGPLASNGTLNGNYLLALSGFKNGSPYLMVGSFITDGAGAITSGKLDINDGSGEHYDPTQCLGNSNCPIAETIQATGSSYDLDTLSNGLGSLTLATLDYAGNPHTYNFNISVSGSACKPDPNHVLNACGRVIESDVQMYGSGVLKVQNPADFPKSKFFPGNFAVGVSGYDASGGRYAAAGAVGTNTGTGNDIDCDNNPGHWGLDPCPLDQNDNGNGGSGSTTANGFKGSFSSTIDTITGRGQYVNLTFPNDPLGYCPHTAACGYIYYVINTQEGIIMATDPVAKPANLTLWSMQRQRSNATNWHIATSISPSNVMQLSANDGGKSDVLTGLFTSDTTGDGTFASDENDGGTLTQLTAQPGTITLGSSGNLTGQFLLGAFPQFGAGGAVMYMWNGASGNPGFVVGTDAKVTAGIMEPQTSGQTGGGFSNGSVSGNYAGSSLSPVLAAVTNSVTYLHADGSGNGTGSQDTSGSNGVNSAPISLTYQIDGTGRGVVLDSQGNQYGFLYVVSSGKFAMVPTGNTPVLNSFFVGQPD